ncbi:carboxylesterase family protein [uncultured Microbulbifer sp.]|uniref:carboxylesterase/lipase family protein n=1 Tax=uncultured Microbulbifer sp. TaxID=348147 RepID=UPI002601FA6D|nr:carboxylesterase family protein [uncultured Microbulbifer sp.]
MRKHLNINLTPTIETSAGLIIGTNVRNLGVYKFLGIPYARPPIGELRWRPPAEPPTWEVPFHAEDFGKPAAQNPSSLMEVRGRNGETPESEECLHLNIFCPTISPLKKLPVMFWIHGGSFYMGSGCQAIYNGSHLAATGRAIVVTFNYRLGSFGFLRLKDLSNIPSSGNEGIMDQIAALKWVKNNIAAFGGNPNNITLFGESAGAMSITSLLNIPGCHGLFSRAIVQSGHPKALHTIESANNIAEAFISHLDKISRKKPLLKCSSKELLEAQDIIIKDKSMSNKWGQLPFKPVVDHELIDNIEHINTAKNSKQPPLLLGNNLEEWNLFSVHIPDTYTLNYKKICQHLEWLIPEKKLKPIILYYHQQAEQAKDNLWPAWSKTWNLMLTDMIFTLPGLRHLDRHQGDCYHYHFTQPLAAQPILGACHAVELGYVFGTHAEESLQVLYGGETDPHLLSATIQEAWLGFAERGIPGDDWPVYTGINSKCFGKNPKGREFNTEKLLNLWQDIPDETLNKYL